MKLNLIKSWEPAVPGIRGILSTIEQKTLIGFGMVPYPRIVPALFLDNYIAYAVKDVADLDVLRAYKESQIFCLEEKFPKAAQKIHAASYLLGNYAFHAFLKSRRSPFRLMLHRTTPAIVQKLEELQVEWVGNRPETFEDLWLESHFHEVLKKLGFPYLEHLRVPKEEIAKITFAQLHERWKQPMEARRVYGQTGVEQTSFTLGNEESVQDMKEVLSKDEKYTEIQISPVVSGLSLSMIGCVTHAGTLTSSLQLQLMDVPEVLHGNPSIGLSLGCDFGFSQWDQEIEHTAQQTTEKIGEFLFERGFRGIFGITFKYDPATHHIFAIDCIPQFTEDLHLYSLGILAHTSVPPMDFFHLMACLKIEESFDFAKVNAGLKTRMPLSHIFLLQKGIEEMKIPLIPGVYTFDTKAKALTYKRPGAFLQELKDPEEFLLIDSVPRMGKKVIDNVPSLFKLIFPKSIAASSSVVAEDTGQLLSALSTALRE